MEFSLWRCPIRANQPAYSQQKEGNQATAPGFQPSGGIASTTRALTHAGRSQYLAKHKGEARATAAHREYRKANRRPYIAANKEKVKEYHREYRRKWIAANREKG